MSKKKPKSPYDLLGIDLDEMQKLQDGLKQYTDLIARSKTLDRIAEQFKQYEDLQWNGLQLLDEPIAVTQAMRDWIERENRLLESFNMWEEMLRPNMEAAALAADSFRNMQEAIGAIAHPFELDRMGEMLSRLSPNIEIEGYVELFDFKRLNTYVGDFDVEHETADVAEDTEGESADSVHFGASLEIHSISAVTDALIEYFAQNPEEMRKIPPRRFEELVAELIASLGFDVELTQQTRDGGYDIVAVKHDLTATRHLIECKRYAEGRPVGVGEVRALYGVVTSENATKGIIVTTSRLSRVAVQEIDKHRWRLGKAEFGDLKAWILAYLKRK